MYNFKTVDKNDLSSSICNWRDSIFKWKIENCFLEKLVVTNYPGVKYLEDIESLNNSSVLNIWPGSLSRRLCIVKLGMFFENPSLLIPFRVKSKELGLKAGTNVNLAKTKGYTSVFIYD